MDIQVRLPSLEQENQQETRMEFQKPEDDLNGLTIINQSFTPIILKSECSDDLLFTQNSESEQFILPDDAATDDSYIVPDLKGELERKSLLDIAVEPGHESENEDSCSTITGDVIERRSEKDYDQYVNQDTLSSDIPRSSEYSDIDETQQNIDINNLTEAEPVFHDANNIKLYKCGHCQNHFTIIDNSDQNTLKNCEIKTCVCTFCEKVVVFRNAKAEQNTGINKCYVCEKTFSCKSKLTRHLKVHDEKKPTKPSHKCDFCEKVYAQRRNLKEHLLIHTGKSWKCEFCGVNFTQKRNLARHLTMHSGNLWKCEICLKGFSLKDNLRQHMRIHSKNKFFKCEICEKVFSLKHHLLQHLHTHSGMKAWKCDLCDKEFCFKARLKRHLLVHTGEKTHKCDFCDKFYISMAKLKLHLRVHTGEKIHKCEFCEKTFTVWASLKAHLANIHSSEPSGKLDGVTEYS